MSKTYKKDPAVIATLTDEQYRITQENGTERPFDNAFYQHKAAGLYVDIVSGEPLFLSTNKYDSNSGWPSFTRPIGENVIENTDVVSHGMTRTEVRSKHANSHLGHVFEDGPQEETGLRYCINSAALRFIPIDQLMAEGYDEYLDYFKQYKDF